MDIKRILTTIIGIPLVIMLIVFGTPQIISFAIMLIAIICMYEYLNVIKKVCKPIQWVAYLSTLVVFFTSVFSINVLQDVIILGMPVILFVLFMHIIFTEMKVSFKDAAYTLLGIIYVTGLIMFLGLIISSEHGKLILGYTIIIAWATDIFAYLAGKKFGKHHFSKVSPKKSIEGCIAGATCAAIAGIVYFVIATCAGSIYINGIKYLYIGLISLVLSCISQVGDFAASSIKRFADVKDYGSLLPGHGGMLDRIDSLIFMAPFVYLIMLIMQIS